MKRMIALCVSLLLAPALAIAHGMATGIVQERMNLMVEVGDAMKVLRAELLFADTPNGARIEKAARTIEERAAGEMTRLFPEGSTMHSEALPSVWTDPARFTTLADDLRIHAATLADAAEKGAGEVALRERFDAVNGTCKACHDDFRRGKN